MVIYFESLKVKQVFPIIFKENGVEKALVTFRLTFVDQYGKEKDDDAIRIVLTKPTSEKSNGEILKKKISLALLIVSIYTLD